MEPDQQKSTAPATDQTTNQVGNQAAPATAGENNPAPKNSPEEKTAPMITPETGNTPDQAKENPASAAPLITPTPAPAVNNPTETIQAKMEAARAAMEGPERTAERQKRELEAKVQAESSDLETEKSKISKEKEKLELVWIDLDNRRSALKKELEPILADETKIEEADKTAELEEEKAIIPADKQKAEKARQAQDEARKTIEEKKWVIQDKIDKLESSIADNTKEYQTLLDQEEKILKELDDLKNQLI